MNNTKGVFVMRLENYLIESKGRSKVIGFDEWLDIAKKKHLKTLRKYVNREEALFRGHTSLTIDDNFGYVIPSKGMGRKSANTSNYYTVWIDNSPKWKGFPKRSKSLICGNRFGAAYGYSSQRFAILPEDNADIAICDESDFWDSFKKTNPYQTLNDFNNAFANLYKQTYGKLAPNHLSPNKLNTALDDINDFIQNGASLQILTHLEDLMSKHNFTFREVFDYILDPAPNKFRLIKSHQPIPQDYDRECWTDGNSLMVNEGVRPTMGSHYEWDKIVELVNK